MIKKILQIKTFYPLTKFVPFNKNQYHYFRIYIEYVTEQLFDFDIITEAILLLNLILNEQNSIVFVVIGSFLYIPN
jgi:hypothetical protein